MKLRAIHVTCLLTCPKSLMFQPSLVVATGICRELYQIHLCLKAKENRESWCTCTFCWDLLLQILDSFHPKNSQIPSGSRALDLIFSSQDRYRRKPLHISVSSVSNGSYLIFGEWLLTYESCGGFWLICSEREDGTLTQDLFYLVFHLMMQFSAYTVPWRAFFIPSGIWG